MSPVGPWGSNGGSNWDDAGYYGVREITLKNGDCIDSMCVIYDKNGKPVQGKKHGGSRVELLREPFVTFLCLKYFTLN